MDFSEVNRVVETAFREHALGNVGMPLRLYVMVPGSDGRTLSASLPSMEPHGATNDGIHPGSRSPALSLIIDPRTGKPLAFLNTEELKTMGTGAAGAVAAKYLSPKKEIVLGLIGAGKQAECQLEAIAQELSVQEVRIWSRDEKRAELFRKKYPRYDIQVCNPKRVCDCDVLVTTTPSRTPIIRNKWIHEGTHINAVGADAPGKQELDPTLLIRGSVYVDDIEQALRAGEINVPVSRNYFSRTRIAGTLGEVVLKKKGRSHDDEITIFASTGCAMQDPATASMATR